MPNVTETKKPNPTSDGGNGSGAGTAEGPSSLDRLADFTRRVLSVPKDELERAEKAAGGAQKPATG